MPFHRIWTATLIVSATGLGPSIAPAQVAFLGFEGAPRAITSANVAFEICNNQSADVGTLATSAQGDSTCTAGTGDFVTTATSSFSAVFTGTEDDVVGASLSASVDVKADANPPNNLSSKSSTGSGGVRMNFNAVSPVRYRVTLTTSVNSAGFSQSGVDEASAALANSGFSAFETLSVEQNFGSDTQTSVREGILPAGTFSLRANVRGTATAPLSADAANASATLEVTFEPLLSGGCCIDGSCSELTREECAGAGGAYAGDNAACVDCEVVVVACDLAWALPETGSFSDKARWSPEAAPTDNGEGCNNLLFNLAGAYTVNLANAAANSVAVQNGQVVMTGNALNLSGRDATALSVDAEGSLKLTTATLHAPQVEVGKNSGGSPGLGLEESSTLTATGEISVAAGPGSNGLLGVSALTGPGSTLNAGTLNVGEFGDGFSFVIGLSTANTTGDMTFGTQIGSKGTGVWTGPTEGTVPTRISVGESLFVGKLGVGDVTANGPFTLECIRLELGSGPAADGSLKILDSTSSAVVGSEFIVGNAGKGLLELADGADLTSVAGTLGQVASGDGTLRIAGAETKLAVLGGLTAGDGGKALLEVKDAGLVDLGEDLIVGKSTGSQGVINVDGATATSTINVGRDLFLGQTGDGHLNIHGNALVLAAGDLRLGTNAGGNGSAFIGFGDADEQAATVSVADTLSIAEGGNASVDILGRALVLCDNLTSATGSGSTAQVTLSGASSQLEVVHHLAVAGGGIATFTVEDANVLSAESATIGAGAGGLGIVRLKGGESHFDVRQALLVGHETNGLLDVVEGGGDVTCASAVVGGNNVAAGGTINLFEGASFSAQTTLIVGANVGPALLRMESGSVLIAGDSVRIASEGLFIARGNALIDTPLVTGSGRIRIANSVTLINKQGGEATGPVHFTGALQLEEGGQLEVEAGDGAALRIDGATTLAGSLVVLLAPDRAYEAAEIIDLIDFAGGTSGDFSNVQFPNASDGFEGSVALQDGALRLTVERPGTGVSAGEGEGEGETPGGCNAGKSLEPVEKLLGDWVTALFGLAVLVGSAMLGRPGTL